MSTGNKQAKDDLKKLKKSKNSGSILNLLAYDSSDDDSGSDEPKKKTGKRKQAPADVGVTVLSGPSKSGPVLVAHPKKKKTGGFSIVGSYGSDDSDSDEEKVDKSNGSIVEISGFHGEMIPVQPDNVPLQSVSIQDSDDLRSMRLLPPEPPGKPNAQVQEKIRTFLQKTRGGVSFNESMLQQKEFHNPYILSKIAETYKIDQTGTNYPKDIYNPREITEKDKYDAIQRQQRREDDKKAEEKKNRTQLEFVPPSPHSLGGMPPASSSSAPATSVPPVTDAQQAITEAQIAAAKSKAKAAVKAKVAAAAAAAKVTISAIAQDVKDRKSKNDDNKLGEKDSTSSSDDKSTEKLAPQENTEKEQGIISNESDEESKSRKKKWDQSNSSSKIKQEVGLDSEIPTIADSSSGKVKTPDSAATKAKMTAAAVEAKVTQQQQQQLQQQQQQLHQQAVVGPTTPTLIPTDHLTLIPLTPPISPLPLGPPPGLHRHGGLTMMSPIPIPTMGAMGSPPESMIPGFGRGVIPNPHLSQTLPQTPLGGPSFSVPVAPLGPTLLPTPMPLPVLATGPPGIHFPGMNPTIHGAMPMGFGSRPPRPVPPPTPIPDTLVAYLQNKKKGEAY